MSRSPSLASPARTPVPVLVRDLLTARAHRERCRKHLQALGTSATPEDHRAAWEATRREDAAEEALWDRLRRPCEADLRRLYADPQVVAEELQELRLKLVVHLPTFRNPDEPTLHAWLRQIRHNDWVSSLRRRGRRQSRQEEVEARGRAELEGRFHTAEDSLERRRTVDALALGLVLAGRLHAEDRFADLAARASRQGLGAHPTSLQANLRAWRCQRLDGMSARDYGRRFRISTDNATQQATRGRGAVLLGLEAALRVVSSGPDRQAVADLHALLHGTPIDRMAA